MKYRILIVAAFASCASRTVAPPEDYRPPVEIPEAIYNQKPFLTLKAADNKTYYYREYIQQPFHVMVVTKFDGKSENFPTDAEWKEAITMLRSNYTEWTRKLQAGAEDPFSKETIGLARATAKKQVDKLTNDRWSLWADLNAAKDFGGKSGEIAKLEKEIQKLEAEISYNQFIYEYTSGLLGLKPE